MSQRKKRKGPQHPSLDKENNALLSVLPDVERRVYVSANIRKAFEECGIWPYDNDRIVAAAFANVVGGVNPDLSSDTHTPRAKGDLLVLRLLSAIGEYERAEISEESMEEMQIEAKDFTGQVPTTLSPASFLSQFTPQINHAVTLKARRVKDLQREKAEKREKSAREKEENAKERKREREEAGEEKAEVQERKKRKREEDAQARLKKNVAAAEERRKKQEVWFCRACNKLDGKFIKWATSHKRNEWLVCEHCDDYLLCWRHALSAPALEMMQAHETTCRCEMEAGEDH